ncbi:MAG: hypothetical protein E7483_01275 [Ruminococcaceae bacterium]|nr:hypothetical protein [Oscillospiraceae bacterium]
MPRISEKMKLSESQDRRRRLSTEQKNSVRTEYSTGLISQRALAKKYGVSRSLIAILVNPERAEKVKQRGKENWKKYHDQYTKDEWARIMREHRNYKQSLYLKGELKFNKEI